MSIEFENLRLSQLRLFLLENIKKFEIAKAEMISQTKSLIKVISQMHNQAIAKLEEILGDSYELLSQVKFFRTQMHAIEEIESKETYIEVSSIEKIIEESKKLFTKDIVKFKERDERNSIEEIKKKEAEEKKRQEEEEENKKHPEKSKKYIGKTDIIYLNAKIQYFQPIIYSNDSYWSMKNCNELIKEILVSDDGQYFFFVFHI